MSARLDVYFPNKLDFLLSCIILNEFLYLTGLLPDMKCAELNETQLANLGFEDNSSVVINYKKCHIEVQNFNKSTNQTLSCINGYNYISKKSSSFVSEVIFFIFYWFSVTFYLRNRTVRQPCLN